MWDDSTTKGRTHFEVINMIWLVCAYNGAY